MSIANIGGVGYTLSLCETMSMQKNKGEKLTVPTNSENSIDGLYTVHFTSRYQFDLSECAKSDIINGNIEGSFEKLSAKYDILAKEIEAKFGKNNNDYYTHMEALNHALEMNINAAVITQAFKATENIANDGNLMTKDGINYYPRSNFFLDILLSNAKRISSDFYEEFINSYKENGYEKAYSDSISLLKNNKTASIDYLSFDDFQMLSCQSLNDKSDIWKIVCDEKVNPIIRQYLNSLYEFGK